MGEAKRNREALMLFNVEQRLAGESICTCPPYWFPSHSRTRLRMATPEEVRREGEEHSRECEMMQPRFGTWG